MLPPTHFALIPCRPNERPLHGDVRSPLHPYYEVPNLNFVYRRPAVVYNIQRVSERDVTIRTSFLEFRSSPLALEASKHKP